MTLPYRGDISLAIKAMRQTKGRSFLTMLGIIIGIVSVVTIVAVAEGIKHQVSGQINTLGKDLIIVRPGQLEKPNISSIFSGINVFSDVNNVSSLTQHDVSVTAGSNGVKEAVPMALVSGEISVNGHAQVSPIVVGTGDQLPDALNQGIQYGGFFDSNDDTTNKAVISQPLAVQLFGYSSPLGRTITFHGQEFIVTGVFNQFNSVPLSFSTNLNNVVFIPFSVAENMTNGTAPIYEILAKPQNPNQTTQTQQAINTAILSAHGGQQDFSVMQQNNDLGVVSGVLNALTELIGAIAGISLLVGGVGIMNVTLVSVSERTREIGVRKAVGATNRQIVGQFVVEAAVLSAFGGLVGIIVSFVVDYTLRVFTNLQPIITWQVMVLATVVSLLIGIVFGTIPALQAAQKDPIDALRYQ